MGATTRKRDSLDLETALLSIWDASPDEQKFVWAVLAEVAKPVIEEQEALYREGSKEVLLGTLALCFRHKVEIPAWIQTEIIRVSKERPRSWDTVFGPPAPKGKKVPAHNRQRQKSMAVIRRVRQMRAQGEPIDEYLFERVGKEFGISGGTAKNYYYDKDLRVDFDAVGGMLTELARGMKTLKRKSKPASKKQQST